MAKVSNNSTSWNVGTNPDIDVDGEIVSSKFRQGIFSYSGFQIPAYDYVSASYPTSTQEIYIYKVGGSSGDIVATITINYLDATKNSISNVSKS